MMSCKKATFLISKSIHQPLSKWERFSLKFHLAICRVCLYYSEQIMFVHNLMQRKQQQIKLSPEAKQRLKKMLNEKTDCC